MVDLVGLPSAPIPEKSILRNWVIKFSNTLVQAVLLEHIFTFIRKYTCIYKFNQFEQEKTNFRRRRRGLEIFYTEGFKNQGTNYSCRTNLLKFVHYRHSICSNEPLHPLISVRNKKGLPFSLENMGKNL